MIWTGPRSLLLALLITGCSSGNKKPTKDSAAPAAPAIRNPTYNPNAPYGEANAIWQPPVFSRDGTIVKIIEPSSQSGRPSYETAPWATGAEGGSRFAPGGTF